MDEIFAKHPQWNDVKQICAKLHENGYTAWLAGGCVRDGLMGIVPKDFDIATNARPKKIESLFNKTVDVGKAFGVIRVVEP
jgi:tRNA nucleotidyltransferase/poly(A) polymerase